MKQLKALKALIMLIFRDFERKHLSLIAAGLAYYFLMSLSPALLVLVGVVSYLPLQNASRIATSLLAHVLPPQGLSLIEPMLATISSHRSGLLSFGILVTLWLASIGAKGIIAGLDIVYEVRTPRPLWINRIFAFALTVAVGLLLLLAVVLTVAGPVGERLLSAAVPVQSLWIRTWPYIQWGVAALFTFAAIELFYLLAPNVPTLHRVTVPGAVIATIVWLALSRGLAVFFNQLAGPKAGVYGTLAAPIALVVWLYWGASALLIGAQINVSLQLYRSLGVLDSEHESRQSNDAA
jgi:membrane protein